MAGSSCYLWFRRSQINRNTFRNCFSNWAFATASGFSNFFAQHLRHLVWLSALQTWGCTQWPCVYRVACCSKVVIYLVAGLSLSRERPGLNGFGAPLRHLSPDYLGCNDAALHSHVSVLYLQVVLQEYI